MTLPHILSQATDSDVTALNIRLTKATAVNSQFTDVDSYESQIYLWEKDGKGYATISLHHFCFISLRAKIDCREAKSFGYCVCVRYVRLRQ